MHSKSPADYNKASANYTEVQVNLYSEMLLIIWERHLLNCMHAGSLYAAMVCLNATRYPSSMQNLLFAASLYVLCRIPPQTQRQGKSSRHDT